MLIDWTRDFDHWYDRLLARAEDGDVAAARRFSIVDEQLALLQRLEVSPMTETQQLKRVRQSRRHQVWRVSHPFERDIAMRLIVWFPPDRPGEAVIVLFGADKARMGDVFYDGVGARADAAIDSYRHEGSEE